jgi:hypothetical protein
VSSSLDGAIWYAGLEQLKGCSINTCSEEGGYSWFWTTPEGYKWPANVIWGSGYPTADTAGSLQNAIINWASSNGYGDTGNVVNFAATVCEYRKNDDFDDD